jgi:hypothetical protein
MHESSHDGRREGQIHLCSLSEDSADNLFMDRRIVYRVSSSLDRLTAETGETFKVRPHREAAPIYAAQLSDLARSKAMPFC